MGILKSLASSFGERGKAPNKELAEKLVAEENTQAIKELVGNLYHSDKNIQSDCIETLYEIGYRKPALIAKYHWEFINLLDNENNRLVWGGMTALMTITELRHRQIFEALDRIMPAIYKGSVITVDGGIVVLSLLNTHNEYFETTNGLLMQQLKKCPIKQLPMYAEKSLLCINEKNKQEFIDILKNRLDECEKDSQKKRIKKVLRQLK
jgi:hypothetical protein